jgi:predicted phage tail protein
MSSKTVKTALVVGAIAVGFAAIPAIGPSAFATKIGTAVGLSGTAAGLVGTFIVSAGSQLVLGAVNKKLAPNIDIPEIGTNLSQGTMVLLDYFHQVVMNMKVKQELKNI